jgi:signal transduction histidine kinase
VVVVAVHVLMTGTVAAAASRVVGRRDDPPRPPGGSAVILEDDAAIVIQDDDGAPACGYLAHTMIARLRALDPFRADMLLAAFLLVEGLLEVVVLVPGRGPRDGLMALAVAGLAACAAVRRRRPVVAAVVGTLLFAAYPLLGQEYIDHLISPFFVALLLIYGIGRHLDGRVVWVVTAFAAVAMAAFTAIEGTDDTLGNYVLGVGGLVVAPVLVGRVIRHRARLNQALREKAARLERERADRAAAAALDERARIAGELHDVVAHALSAMVVQASGARRLAERDPARAADAFQTVETSGREALTEIRRLLGVLRRDDEELALAPQPSLRHVGSLVRKIEAAGLPVQLEVEGEQQDLPFGVDLTAYRVVQEALGGALDHGHAGHARVRLRYGVDHVELEVRDDGRAAERPLLGVRERVALSGGQLRAGARRDGGHVVRARLPLGGAA